MKIITALCSVVYSGRGDTVLQPFTRIIMVKEDGAVSVHGAAGNKPLNYMGAPNTHTIEHDEDGNEIWIFDTRKETLRITIHEIYAQFEHQMDLGEPGLVRDGTEKHLQEWLAERPHLFGENYELVQREFQTGAGPIDILFKDPVEDEYLAVEVKRVAMIASVDQVRRYRTALEDTLGKTSKVKMMLAALDVRPHTKLQAEKHNIPYMEIEWHDRNLNGIEDSLETGIVDTGHNDEKGIKTSETIDKPQPKSLFD